MTRSSNCERPKCRRALCLRPVGYSRIDTALANRIGNAPGRRRGGLDVSARELAPWRINRGSPRTALGGLLCDLVLRDDGFGPREIFQQPVAGQDEEVIAELRILKVDLQQLFVSDGQHMTVLDAFDRRGPAVVGRKETEF